MDDLLEFIFTRKKKLNCTIYSNQTYTFAARCALYTYLMNVTDGVIATTACENQYLNVEN